MPLNIYFFLPDTAPWGFYEGGDAYNSGPRGRLMVVLALARVRGVLAGFMARPRDERREEGGALRLLPKGALGFFSLNFRRALERTRR